MISSATGSLGYRTRKAGEHIANLKRPFEAVDIAAGIITHKKNPGCAEVESVCQQHSEEPAMHLYPYSIIPSCQEVHLLFILSIKRVWHCSGQCRGNNNSCNMASQHGHLVAVTCVSYPVTPILIPCMHLIDWYLSMQCQCQQSVTPYSMSGLETRRVTHIPTCQFLRRAGCQCTIVGSHC